MDFQKFDLLELLKKQTKVKRDFTRAYEQLSYELSNASTVTGLQSGLDNLDRSMDIVYALYDALMEKYDSESPTVSEADSVESWYRNIFDLLLDMTQ